MNSRLLWHEKDGVAYPQTFGKPQRMLFPRGFDAEIISTLKPNDARVVITFKQIDNRQTIIRRAISLVTQRNSNSQ